ALLGTAGRLLLFLVAVIALGMLLVPRFVRSTLRLGHAETTVHLLRGRTARQPLRLFGRAGRVRRGIARRRIGRGRTARAPAPARARSVRRGVLRVGGDADRSGADRPPRGSRCLSWAPSSSW